MFNPNAHYISRHIGILYRTKYAFTNTYVPDTGIIFSCLAGRTSLQNYSSFSFFFCVFSTLQLAVLLLLLMLALLCGCISVTDTVLPCRLLSCSTAVVLGL